MKKTVVVLIILGILGVAGCSDKKEPQPQDRFAAYIKLWNQQKFDQMYSYLSDDAKKDVSKKQFTERYTKIYKDLEITDLKVDFKKPKEEKRTKPVYSFSVKMNSIAGPIEFTNKARMKNQGEKEKNWFVDWNTTFIFPKMAPGDKLSVQTDEPMRGEILDRNGHGLAINGQVYEVGVIPGNLSDNGKSSLAGLIGMPVESINKALSANWVKPDLFVPLKRVSSEDPTLIDRIVSIDGVRTKKADARMYPYGEAAAQLIGYVGPITADELKAHPGYKAQDLIGKRGLEQVYDEQLKGKEGVRIMITKKLGGVEVLAEKPVQDGQQIQLTIDARLQEKMFGELKGEAGTAAAMNPVSGETLALVSSPSFDPNKASLGFSAAEWKALQENALSPLTTRFKQAYVPGSVLKPVVALVGLGNGAIKPGEEVAISGKKWQKGKSWGKYYVTRVHVENKVNLEKSLVFSDNIYFAQAALKMGKDKFVSGLKAFGFDQDFQYPFPLAKSSMGALGSEIALADSGYGQGQMQVNVVQLMAMYSVFANGGEMVRPILLEDEERGQKLGSVASKQNATLVSEMMRKVVSDVKGTAHLAEIPGYPLAGKTGTAEIKQKQGEVGTENGWFVAYNPESPDLLVAMMVEGVQDRGGSVVAVKKVKDIFETGRP